VKLKLKCATEITLRRTDSAESSHQVIRDCKVLSYSNKMIALL